MKLVKAISVAAVILGLALAFPAAAVTVSYTVGGWGPQQFPGPDPVPVCASPCNVPANNGYPGDTVEFQAYTGTLSLTPGSYTLKINTLYWTVDYTWAGRDCAWYCAGNWDQLFHNVNAPRSITINSQTFTLGQAGIVENGWDDDWLSFAIGSTVSFMVEGEPGTWYPVQVTPIAFPRAGFGSWPTGQCSVLANQSSPQAPMCYLPCSLCPVDVMAVFEVDLPVPVDPSTWGKVKALYE
jgi:hypothetical protein